MHHAGCHAASMDYIARLQHRVVGVRGALHIKAHGRARVRDSGCVIAPQPRPVRVSVPVPKKGHRAAHCPRAYAQFAIDNSPHPISRARPKRRTRRKLLTVPSIVNSHRLIDLVKIAVAIPEYCHDHVLLSPNRACDLLVQRLRMYPRQHEYPRPKYDFSRHFGWNIAAFRVGPIGQAKHANHIVLRLHDDQPRFIALLARRRLRFR